MERLAQLVRMAGPRLTTVNVYSFSFSTVLLDAPGHGQIDHAACAGLSPISQRTKRILLVFRQTFFEISPGRLEVLLRQISESLPFSKERLALSARWVSGYCKSYESVRRLLPS